MDYRLAVEAVKRSALSPDQIFSEKKAPLFEGGDERAYIQSPSILDLALINGDHYAVATLLERGARINHSTACTALLYSGLLDGGGVRRTFDLLLKHGLNLNAPLTFNDGIDRFQGASMLHYFVTTNETENGMLCMYSENSNLKTKFADLKYLLSKGADPFVAVNANGSMEYFDYTSKKVMLITDYYKGAMPIDFARLRPFPDPYMGPILQEYMAKKTAQNERRVYSFVTNGVSVRATASSAAVGHEFKYAFDGNPSTSWQAENQGREVWIEFTFQGSYPKNVDISMIIPEGSPDSISYFEYDGFTTLKDNTIVQNRVESSSTGKGLKMVMSIPVFETKVIAMPRQDSVQSKVKLQGNVGSGSRNEERLLGASTRTSPLVTTDKSLIAGTGWTATKFYLTGWNGVNASFAEIRLNASQ